VPCAVAFLRNEERNVFLGMHGLPRPPEGVEFGRALPKAVVRSVPLVLLADAGTRMSTGRRSRMLRVMYTCAVSSVHDVERPWKQCIGSRTHNRNCPCMRMTATAAHSCSFACTLRACAADADYVRRLVGIVLSHAPLMGADPVIDEAHNRWLHIHVRPPVTGMLKVRSCWAVVAS